MIPIEDLTDVAPAIEDTDDNDDNEDNDDNVDNDNNDDSVDHGDNDNNDDNGEDGAYLLPRVHPLPQDNWPVGSIAQLLQGHVPVHGTHVAAAHQEQGVHQPPHQLSPQKHHQQVYQVTTLAHHNIMFITERRI